MAPKRNIETPDTNSKPKKTRRLTKTYKHFNYDKIDQMIDLFKACQNGNHEKVKQILKTMKTSEINLQITPKEIQEKKFLHAASKKGSVEIVEKLLKFNIDIDDTNSRGETALLVATQSGHAKIVAILLAKGADVNFHLDVSKSVDDVETYDYWSGDTRALHIAARHGYEDVMSELLKYDVEIDVRTIHKETALHLASDRGHASVVAQLLEHGANAQLFSEHSNIVSNKALHVACEEGHLKVVKELLKFDKEIDCKNEDGESPLHMASKNGQPEIVKELLDHGASIDLHLGNKPEKCNGLNCVTSCVREGNALHLAIKSGNVETVQLLLNGGAKLNNTCSSNDFLKACQLGHLEVVKELIRRGANIHEQIECNQKTSPLHVAISYGKIEVVKELLRLGVDFNLEDEYYGTPLNVAAVDGYLEIVKLLLELGANPYHKFKEHGDDYMEDDNAIYNANANEHHTIVEELLLHGNADAIVDDHEWTSLHHASHTGNLAAVRKLLVRGCDVNARTYHNTTPLYHALEYSFLHDKADDVVLHLLHHGADLNIQDYRGNTPLHCAVKFHIQETSQSDMNVFQLVLENGKDINFALKNKEGKTVLQIAIDKKYNVIARMIAKRMCPKSNITHSIYPFNYFF